jgi:hypothetical protein
MTKYESVKYLVKQKARIQHECHRCGKLIKSGDFYFKEKIDMSKPPSLILYDFCIECIERH